MFAMIDKNDNTSRDRESIRREMERLVNKELVSNGYNAHSYVTIDWHIQVNDEEETS